MNPYLTFKLLPEHIHYLRHQKNIRQNQKGQHQVYHPDQKLEYRQELLHHRKLISPNKYCNPHQTYSILCVNFVLAFVEVWEIHLLLKQHFLLAVSHNFKQLLLTLMHNHWFYSPQESQNIRIVYMLKHQLTTHSFCNWWCLMINCW